MSFAGQRRPKPFTAEIPRSSFSQRLTLSLLRPALKTGGRGTSDVSASRSLTDNVCGWVSCPQLRATGRWLTQSGPRCNEGRSHLTHGSLVNLSAVDPVLSYGPQSPPSRQRRATSASAVHGTAGRAQAAHKHNKAPGPLKQEPSASRDPTAPPGWPRGRARRVGRAGPAALCSDVHTRWAAVSLGRSL